MQPILGAAKGALIIVPFEDCGPDFSYPGIGRYVRVVGGLLPFWKRMRATRESEPLAEIWNVAVDLVAFKFLIGLDCISHDQPSIDEIG